MDVHIIDTERLSNNLQISEAIKAIFSTNQLTDFHQALVKTAGDKKITDIGQLSDFCLSEISNISADSIAIAKLRNQLLVQVLNFQSERLENADAYDPKTKPNPLAVTWPDPKYGQTVFDAEILVERKSILNKLTPVGSAGSCFAMEIAHWMQRAGFNYLVTERNIHPERGTHWSNARWGTIFNAAAFRQLIERSFGISKLPNYLWRTSGKDGRDTFRDPFREEVEFYSVKEYLDDLPAHQEAARRALSTVKVFIITLGLNEVWSFRADGSILSRNPWHISPSYVKRRVLGVEENIAELQRMLDVWRTFNPDLQLIVSVSPVPMLRTFQASEMHVMAATMLSKATLRVAAQRFCDDNQGVYYFPSFEKIMYGTRNPWEPDYRHVRPQAVAGVMELFERSFVHAIPTNIKEHFSCDFLVGMGRPDELKAVAKAVQNIKNAVNIPEVHSLLDTFLEGYKTYAKTGITPEPGYNAMRQLFAITNGVFNRVISEGIRVAAPVVGSCSYGNIFGDSMEEVLAGLDSNGYWVFKEKLEQSSVDYLVNYAMSTPATGRAGGGKLEVKSDFKEMRKHGNALFQFNESDLVADDAVWEICKNPLFVGLARRYLKCEPILDLVTMWWSLAASSNQQERSAAAQLFHFDLDRLSFIKFFIYLTDVGPANGPHCYISGSHQGFKNTNLQRDGRFSDEEIKAYYPSEEIQITGPKGTIFVADTKGFHKGLPPVSGDRLIFQIEFANSLFGAPYVSWNRVIDSGSMHESYRTNFIKLSGNA